MMAPLTSIIAIFFGAVRDSEWYFSCGHVGRAEVAVITAVKADDDHHANHQRGQQPVAEPPESGGALLHDDLRWGSDTGTGWFVLCHFEYSLIDC